MYFCAVVSNTFEKKTVLILNIFQTKFYVFVFSQKYKCEQTRIRRLCRGYYSQKTVKKVLRIINKIFKTYTK